MNNLLDIKKRLESVKQTQKITKAMETISVAKMQKAMQRFEDNREYFDVLYGVMAHIALNSKAEIGELLSVSGSKKLVVAIASDKGLCGSFNHDVFKLLVSVVDADTVVMPIGSTSCDFCKKNSFSVDERLKSYALTPSYDKSKEVAEILLSESKKNFGSVKIVYTKMISKSLWAPKVLDLLPLNFDETNSKDFSGIEFEPSAKEVFEFLMPLYASGMVYGCMVHSAAAEHAARHSAMAASSKNADDMIAALSTEYNCARQAAVTTQLIDIIGSSRAIGKV